MRRVLSVVVAVTLLLGLGALAVMALPPATASLAVVPSVSAAQPEAPAATENYNMIAMPLDATNQFTSAGLTYDQAGLGTLVGNGVQQVLKWNAPTQSYLIWYPPASFGDTFPLETGQAYWLLLDSAASDIVSFVGDVPAQGSVHFNLTRATGAECAINNISLPLDRADITTPQQLATAVGDVEQVLEWNAATQSYSIWYVDPNFGDPITMKIGYPYLLCLKSTGVTTWP